MSGATFIDELDELVLECERIVDPRLDDVAERVCRLNMLIGLSPPVVNQRFQKLADDRLEALLSVEANEQALLDICSSQSIIVSKNPKRFALATVALPEMGIEQTFSTRGSLSLALIGAICLAMLDVYSKAGRPLPN